MRMRLALAIAWMIVAAIASPAFADPSNDREFLQLKSIDAIQLRGDRAYLLLRIDTGRLGFGPAVLRVPDAHELDAYDAAKRAAFTKMGKNAGPYEILKFDYQGPPNLFLIAPKTAIAASGKVKTVLVEATPGDYILYGLGGIYECFCLGTVGFAAPAGRITDLGTMITDWAWQPSEHPELSGEVDLGPSADIDYGLFATAMRPVRASDSMPDGIDRGKVFPAIYHAIGPYLEPSTNLVNRLAPMPGILAYDRGRVIDVQTGAEAPSNIP